MYIVSAPSLFPNPGAPVVAGHPGQAEHPAVGGLLPILPHQELVLLPQHHTGPLPGKGGVGPPLDFERSLDLQ